MNTLQITLSLWQFPASLILGVAFVLLLWIIDRYYTANRLYRLLSGAPIAIALTAIVALALLLEGTWAWGLYRTVPFVAVVLLWTASLGLVSLRALRQRRSWAFCLNHGGLFLILWAGIFGAADCVEGRMVIRKNSPEHLAYTSSKAAIPLPFEVELQHFEVEYYDDATTPRQFRSQVRIAGKSFDIRVNAPLRYRGYTLYQDSYDRQHEAYSVLLVKRDPWLVVTWIGIALLAIGSLLYIFRK